jgi:hypothetical protein
VRPRRRVFVEYWWINIRDSVDHWARHETIPMLIGYAVAAFIAFAAIFFGVRDDDGVIEIAQSVGLALALGAVGWLLILVVAVNPTRIWNGQREVILSLLQQFEDVRDLSDLIARLKVQQEKALGFMRRIQIEGGDVSDDEFWAWTTATGAAIREAGDEHLASYSDSIARMSEGNPDHLSMLRAMISLLTDIISSLAAKRAVMKQQAREFGQ